MYSEIIRYSVNKFMFMSGVIIIFWRNIPKRLIKKSILIASAIAAGSLFLSTIGVVALLIVDGRSRLPDFVQSTPTPEVSEYNDAETNESTPASDIDEVETDEGSFLRAPARTNFLLIGLDHNNLTDALMVGCFYRDTGDIRMMSVPRDMYTRLPAHRLEQMRAEGLRPPEAMKINALRAFGGRNGVYYLKHQLGEMLGVEFHYYVEVNLAAFRRIVDAIGDVYIYVPVRMFYDPPDQDLIIDLQPGLQRLDGRMAEGLVRFRHFPTGDLGRNQTHLDFMAQLISQILTREAIMNEPLTMINIVLNDVRSNIGLDAIRYIPYIRHMSSDRIFTYVMPGRGEYLGGVSWFLPDADRVPGVVNQVFYAEAEANDGMEYSTE